VRTTGAEILDAIGVRPATAFLAACDAVLMVISGGRVIKEGREAFCPMARLVKNARKKGGTEFHASKLPFKEVARVRGMQC